MISPNRAPTLVLVTPGFSGDDQDVWLPVESRPHGSRLKAQATLYIRGAESPFLRVSTTLMDAIGDPNHVTVQVNPRRRQLRLVPNMQGQGRQVTQRRARSLQVVIAASGIPLALGFKPVIGIVRFDAEATEDHITLTMRGEP